MNLTKLFEAQKALDERIVAEKGLQGQNLLSEKILALQVELGELANEWRVFKFWSKDREPRTSTECERCEENAVWCGDELFSDDCPDCNSTGFVNPLLEEYVDCLHFLLSIGLELEVNENLIFEGIPQHSEILMSFAKINRYVARLWWQSHDGDANAGATWYHAVLNFMRLGELLGFTWQQTENAYFAKNRTNHKRQATGY